MRTFLLIFAASLFVALAALSPGRSAAVAIGPPHGAILSPPDGAVIPFNTDITFSGSGADSDGAPLVRGQLFWTSSQNGFLGSGPSFTRNSSTLNAGAHAIRLLLTGNNFQQSSVQVTIWIGPPPASTPTHTPTATPTSTNTPTNTPVPPANTNTPSPTATNTPAPARQPSATATPRLPTPCADVDGDGRVGWSDVSRIVRAVKHRSRDRTFDVNGDGRVDRADIREAIRQPGRRCHGAATRTR